jgi:hypothetical protein
VTATPGSFVPPGGATESTAVRVRRIGEAALIVLAVIGALLGLGMVWFHLTTDPLTDVRAYYDAATRLNAGRALYPAAADSNLATFYRYPPLLAILMRPFAAFLPFHVFALGWEAVVVASFVSLLRRLGANRRAFIAVGLLGMPIGWALAIGQAQVPMTLLMAIGQPWSIALAANLKLFPLLIVIWWLGRREYQAVGATIAWMLLIGLLQLALAPSDSIRFFSAIGLDQVAGIQNLSPYVISPILWAVLAAAGAIAVAFLAPTRWGWPAAVALATLASPRLLVYMLMSLLAGVREPDPPQEEDDGRGTGSGRTRRPPRDAAEAYVASARGRRAGNRPAP